MLTNTTKEQIADATVTVIAKGGPSGRGVLVAGGMILTAAHCIEYSSEAMPSGDEPALQQIKTDAEVFKLDTLAVEPVADVALLCSLDGQPDFERDIQAYGRFCDRVAATKVYTSSPKLEKSFTVFVLTHHGDWVAGKATPHKWMLSVEFEGDIPTGTSGSPIVNLKGEIVGLISVLGGTDSNPSGPAPRPHLTLPVWAVNLITEVQDEKSL
jgi:hypothetical protein